MNVYRGFSQLFLLVVILSLVAGCAPAAPQPAVPAAAPTEASVPAAQPTESPAAKPTEAPTAGGKSCEGVTLRISTIADVYASVFRAKADEIEQTLGVKMEFDNTPPQDSYKKDMLDFTSGIASHDLILFMPAWLADYSQYLEPIANLEKDYGVNYALDDIMPVYRQTYVRWGGVDYTVPFDGDQHNLYYNKKAFEDEKNKADFKAAYNYDLKPPETWDEYQDVAKFFNGRDWDGSGKLKYGVAEAWQRGGYAFWWWWDKFTSMGGVPFDENMKPLINTPAGVKALEVMLNTKQYAPPGVANFGYPELEAALLKAEVPMVMQWASTGKAAMDPKQSTIVNNIGAALLPGTKMADGTIYRRPGLPTGWVAGIPKLAANKECAARVLEIISTPEHSLWAALDPATAVDPWRTSSYNSPEWSSMWPENTEYSKQYANVLRQTVEMGIPDMQVPGTYEYWNAADLEISEALAGKKSAQEAMDAAAKEWDAITKRFGVDAQKKAWNTQYDALKALGIEYMPDLVK
jgi:multiple sugar transport system substrate-binding protein